MLLVANSTPIVDFDSKLNSLRVNRERRFDFPTPESPISTTETIDHQASFNFTKMDDLTISLRHIFISFTMLISRKIINKDTFSKRRNHDTEHTT